jgi:FKBP-type peptidyl-prolyl cis-trans isomerase FkpA
MKRIFTLLLAVSFSSSAYAVEPPKTEEQKALYAIGQTVYRSLAVFNLSPAEFETVKQGITDSHAGVKSDIDPTAYTVKVQELAKERRKAAGEKQAQAGKAFLELAAKEKGAVKTESGMVYLAQVEGKGGSPKANDVVTVNYRGTLIDGKEFDSSYKRGKPLEFKLDNVIKCWTEGVQKMKVGGTAKLVCPANLAYGESGAGEQILPGATLAFEVELIDFKPALDTKAPVPPAPSKLPALPKAAAPPVPAKTGEK